MDSQAPVILHTPPVEPVLPTDTKLQATISDNIGVKGAKLYYKTNLQINYSYLNMVENQAQSTVGGAVYEAVVPSNELIGVSTISYYFEATDGYNNVTLPIQIESPYMLTIQQGPVVLPTPSLWITEIIQDTANISGADGYEFIEVFNNSDQPVNIKDYKIIYNLATDWYITTDTVNNISNDVTIPAKGTAVIWVSNIEVKDLAAFRSTYKISDNVPICTMKYGGISNSGARYIGIAKKDDKVTATDQSKLISKVYYDANAGDVKTYRSVIYGNPNPETKQMTKIANDQYPTPGIQCGVVHTQRILKNPSHNIII